MAQKKPLTDEELLAQFEDLGGKSTPASAAAKGAKSTSTKSSAPLAANDPLAELENLANFKPTSRPNTPKLSLNQRNQGGAATPSSTGSARTSEDKPRNPPRKSGESTRSYHQGLTPTSEEERAEEEAQHARAEAEQEEKAAASSAGGGWGGWFSGITAAASAAAKQAEAAVKEIQKNEEAQKWAEQMRGNVGALRGLGMLTDLCMLYFVCTNSSTRRRLAIASFANIYQPDQYSRTTNLTT